MVVSKQLPMFEKMFNAQFPYISFYKNLWLRIKLKYFFFQFMGIIFFQTVKLLGPTYWINEIYGGFFFLFLAQDICEKTTEMLRCHELGKFGNLRIREIQVVSMGEDGF